MEKPREVNTIVMIKRHLNVLYISAFLLLAVVIWTVFFTLPAPEEVSLDGIAFKDLTHYDFTNTIYNNIYGWESYPEKLYTPEDFAAGAVIEQPFSYNEMDYSRIQYATHRLRITLLPGRTYGLQMQSADFSMRFFIDGVEVDCVGVPGDTREATIPRTLKRVYIFNSESGKVDIIVQAANFVHREGAYPPNLFIGSVDNIIRKNDRKLFNISALFFCLITSSLYHFGLFVINHKRKAALLFSFCCLFLSFLNYKTIIDFFPDYNWFVAIRFEYINHYLVFTTFLMFLETLHPKLLLKYITRVFYVISGLYIVVTLILDTKVFTALLYYYDSAAALMAVYVLARLVMNMRNKNTRNVLTFAGTLLVVLLGFFDIFNKLNIAAQLQLLWVAGLEFMSPIGMIFMVFCNALAVALDYAETEHAYAEALREIADVRLRLDKLAQSAQNRVGTHIGDFGLSPRETDIAMLLLSGKTRDEIGKLLFISAGSVNTYCSRIYKKTGCSSRAEFARLLNYDIEMR